MNKVIFCHDGPLRVDNSGNIYSQTYNPEFFERYKIIADKVVIINRTVQVEEDKKNISKFKDNDFEIINSPDYSNIKNYLFKKHILTDILNKTIEKNDFMVVRLPSFIGEIAHDYARKNNIPCLVEVVGDAWDAYWNHSWKGKVIAPYAHLKMKKLVKNSNFVVYVTSQYLQKRYPTNGKTISASNVSLNEINQENLNKRILKIKNKNDKVVIGTTASVEVRYKGQEYVIRALSLLKNKGFTNYEYQLVGGGNPQYLRKIAEEEGVIDQIKFVGSLSHKDVFEWLEDIDLYAQPSKQEGLPRALIEAMSLGVPSLGARTAGIPELLEKEFIFDHGKNSAEQIANIVLSFDDTTLIRAATENFNEAKKYDKKAISKRRTNFFEEFRNFNSKV